MQCFALFRSTKLKQKMATNVVTRSIHASSPSFTCIFPLISPLQRSFLSCNMALYRIDIQFIILVWPGTGTKINISGQKTDRRGGVVFFLGANLKLRYSSPPVHNK